MKVREIVCEYQPYVLAPPVRSEQLRENSTRNDSATINHWEEIWLTNIRANKESVGSFADSGLQGVFGKYKHRPVILAGSGPSLKYNVDQLRDRGGIPLVSCLHNFHYFEDRGIAPEFYVTLDAGPITTSEVSVGGEKTAEEYWEISKDRTLIAFIGTDPTLIEKWQGKILWYSCPIPSKDYQEKCDAIEHFHTFVSCGGNVLGSCLYIAKAYLGSSTTIFIGADFCFEGKKFHDWDDPTYDSGMGHCIRTVDVFGNGVKTWQSYKNFKDWFDWVALNVPGIYINCTEGGTFGAYPEGNIMQIKQMDLKDCLEMFNMSDKLQRQAMTPGWHGDLRIDPEVEERPADLQGFNYVLF